jgi:hypothetical protein
MNGYGSKGFPPNQSRISTMFARIQSPSMTLYVAMNGQDPTAAVTPSASRSPNVRPLPPRRTFTGCRWCSALVPWAIASLRSCASTS